MFLLWCSLLSRLTLIFFAIRPFGFSVLTKTENQSPESFNTNVTLYLLIFKGTLFSHIRIVFEKFKRREE